MDKEPLYGQTYLPRKFKIAIAVPPSVRCILLDFIFIFFSRKTRKKLTFQPVLHRLLNVKRTSLPV